VILQITGTSGAGKSYLIRQFMRAIEHDGVVRPLHIAGRKAPIGYDLEIGKLGYHVVGSYEDADTAGCDTIRNVGDIFDLVRKRHASYEAVLFEGLFVMNVMRGKKLAEEFRRKMAVMQLMVPLSQCLASIDERRERRGQGRLLSKDNTRGNYQRAENYSTHMRAAGAQVIKVSREVALGKLLEVLKVVSNGV
jgi:hypothetical protein